MKFTALLHHVSLERLRECFGQLERNAAPGVDGVTWAQYASNLEDNLKDLHARVQRGAYRAKPSRRVYIPKADGRERPIGIAAMEDKIVQRAVAEVLNAVYETDFLGFSYGFRPGRGQHHALDALAGGIFIKKVNWVLDADIRDCFGTIDHGWLKKFVEHRIADQRVLRLLDQWLSAGVIEDGTETQCEQGTPQGATLSPLLANIYLHYVIDLWAARWRRREARGDMIILRYADDTIVGFEVRAEAERYQRELDQRLAKFGLELNPGKTRLVRFGRYADERAGQHGEKKAGTFDFLGFTHICGKSKNGKFLLIRHTMRKRMTARLKELKKEIMRRRHSPVPEQGERLGSVLRGYMAYHAVPTNIHAMETFRAELTRHWYRALRRRSQKTSLNWERMKVLQARWLPPVRIQHPWPLMRFDARTRGRSPVR